MPKENRKQIILQSLASLLEERNLSKVTTALLAEKSSITEAALYRHFPSKRSIYLESELDKILQSYLKHFSDLFVFLSGCIVLHKKDC